MRTILYSASCFNSTALTGVPTGRPTAKPTGTPTHAPTPAPVEAPTDAPACLSRCGTCRSGGGGAGRKVSAAGVCEFYCSSGGYCGATSAYDPAALEGAYLHGFSAELRFRYACGSGCAASPRPMLLRVGGGAGEEVAFPHTGGEFDTWPPPARARPGAWPFRWPAAWSRARARTARAAALVATVRPAVGRRNTKRAVLRRRTRAPPRRESGTTCRATIAACASSCFNSGARATLPHDVCTDEWGD